MAAHSAPRVLIVDDEPFVREALTEALQALSCRVTTAASSEDALQAIEKGCFDVVLCDIVMPGANGLELLAMAQRLQWDVGFILITGHPDVNNLISALRLGAADFLVKPFSVADVSAAVDRAYRRVLTHREARAYWNSLQDGIQRRTHDLELALRHLDSSYQTTFEALVAALDMREHETFAHSFRVRAYTSRLAREVGYSSALVSQVEQAALLHDIGKIAIPDSILLKRGPLTPDEFEYMKKHPVVGEQMLNRIAFLKPATLIVRHHHERFDGSGYPDGLAGDAIPLGDRLFAVADAFDAMTSDRFYRKAPGFAIARDEITRGAGTQFDPRVVNAFLRIPEDAWLELRLRVEQESCKRYGTNPV